LHTMSLTLPDRLLGLVDAELAGDVFDGDSGEPLVTVAGVIAVAGAIETKVAGEPAGAELLGEDSHGVAVELFVGHFGGQDLMSHGFLPRTQSIGFMTEMAEGVGRPADRRMKRSSTVSRTGT
jgi:hypothetical protein